MIRPMSAFAPRKHALCATVAIFALASLTAAAEQQPETIAAPVGGPFQLQRAGSCAAQACHGDVRADNVFPEIWGNELTIWIERDPHAQAFQALSNARSQAMAKALGLSEPAYRARQCLVCHSPADAEHPPANDLASADGVSCESCHGPAEKWLSAHTLRGWREKTPAEKARQGMNDTNDLLTRARICTPCHVGAAEQPGQPGGDVNHDLIAAGHPAVKFEFSAYQAKMPKHWDEHALDPARADAFDPAFEARSWAVGQAVSAEATLSLLAHRASSAAGSPWPEFAEYNCFACHHDLQPEGWRQVEYAARREAAPPGLPAWGTWSLPMLEVLADARPNRSDDISAKVVELASRMRSPGANRRQLAARAAEAAEVLHRWAPELGQKRFNAAELAALRAALAEAAPRLVDADWDAAAQFYLAVVALRLADRPSLGNPALVGSLNQLRGSLMFPAATSRGDLRRFDSPRDFDPRQLAESLETIE
ncbi:MAG: multiheme c-type cytochrome, partial [Candidatus Saccharimonadales bacterium]